MYQPKSILLTAAALICLAVIAIGEKVCAADTPVTLDESQLFVAPNDTLQNFTQTINLKKGQDKLELTLTYYDGSETAPSFKTLRVSSPTMNYLTEQQFGKKKLLSLDVTGELTWGGLQLMIQAQGQKGATFGWRVTTPKPTVTAVYPASARPGETITISGTNLCLDPAHDVAIIDGQATTCIDANFNRIVVRLPEDVSSGTVKGNLVVAGIDAGRFDVNVEAVPEITGLGGSYQAFPGSAGYFAPDYPITVMGKNFSANPANMKVTIGPFTCAILNATTDSVTVRAPIPYAGNPWGIHQPIKIWVNGVRAEKHLYVSIYNLY